MAGLHSIVNHYSMYKSDPESVEFSTNISSNRRRLTRYIVRRILFIPLGLFIVASLSFGLVNLTPGDPIRDLAGGMISDERLALMRAEFGLDAPILERYVEYLSDLSKLDMGTSYLTKRPISSEVWERLGSSVELVVMSLVIAGTVGLTVGFIGARFRRRWPDVLGRITMGVFQSLPDFFVGLVFIYLLFFRLKILPAPVGRVGILEELPPTVTGGVIVDSMLAGRWDTVTSALWHSLMPVLALGLVYSAYVGRVARAALGSAFQSRSVEFARACGMRERTIAVYAIRDAAAPLLTYGATLFAILVGGAAIVETVFAWNGLGQWGVERILRRDLPAIQGFVVVVGGTSLITYLLLDLVLPLVDPRLRDRSG
jgi:ABC-type dipeptide/oligopeptide/nickel transport system permease component